MPYQPAADALKGVKVLDLTRVRSGPTAVRQLGDWGADVIKIEQPESLEPDGSLGAPRHTADFQNLQRNKRSLTLNLKSAEGLAIFKRLAANADVVVENYRPDVKNRLGINYETLSALNPRLIYASISGFGQEGPDRNRPGFDQIAQGMGGLMSITGLPGQGPVRVGIPIADLCAGLFCAQGVLLALYEREQSGQGQWLHTSLLEAMLFMLDFQAARWLVDQEVPGQAGNNHPTSIPTGVFETSDGHINIAVAGEQTWQRFCATLEQPQWQTDPRYIDGRSRSKNRDALNAEINQITATGTSSAWIERLAEEGVPCGEIFNIEQAFANPQVQTLGMTSSVDSAAMGKINLVAQPINLTRTPSHIKVAPPERGEQTEELLGELGFTGDEITDLRTRQII